MTSRTRPRRRLATNAPATMPVEAKSDRFLRGVPQSRELTGWPARGQVGQESEIFGTASACSCASADCDSVADILSHIARFGKISRSLHVYELISGFHPRRTMDLGQL